MKNKQPIKTNNEKSIYDNMDKDQLIDIAAEMFARIIYDSLAFKENDKSEK